MINIHSSITNSAPTLRHLVDPIIQAIGRPDYEGDLWTGATNNGTSLDPWDSVLVNF